MLRGTRPLAYLQSAYSRATERQRADGEERYGQHGGLDLSIEPETVRRARNRGRLEAGLVEHAPVPGQDRAERPGLAAGHRAGPAGDLLHRDHHEPAYENADSIFGLWQTDIRFDYCIDPPLLRPDLLGDDRGGEPLAQPALGVGVTAGPLLPRRQPAPVQVPADQVRPGPLPAPPPGPPPLRHLLPPRPHPRPRPRP